MARPAGTQAVDRAAQLVAAVLEDGPTRSLAELVAASGLPKSTASRLLHSLERGGLVERAAGGFRPGPLFVRFAWRSGGDADLATIAQPHLERLGAETGETVNLGVARAGAVEQIAQVDSRYVLGGTNWVGRRVPLHASALGKVLLAFGGTTLPTGRLESFAPATVTSRSRLGRQLAEVRRDGVAVTVDELEPGLVAVAAPVWRAGSQLVAAISVSGPAHRLDLERLSEARDACALRAGELSAALGHRRTREGAA
jgi:DNA-binding IclR family transcriptional regulator